MLFSSQTMMDSYTTAMTRIETNKKVGIVFDNSVDGVTLSSIMIDDLEKKGFEVVDPGRFPVGTTDYSGIINAFREADCEIVTVNLVDPDFATMWKQFNQQGYIPKVLNTGKAVHYTAGVETLGQDAAGNYLGDGVITDTFWEPYYPFINTLNGQTAAEMNKDFEDATPGYFADTTLGEDWATFEVLNYLFTTAGTLDKETLRDTLAATDIPTSIGQVKFADNHVFQFPLVTCQWHRTEDGKWIRNIVANDDFPDIPLSDTPIFPLPGYTN
jgi:branched-chain amino acid transport system substrate-binding protein